MFIKILKPTLVFLVLIALFVVPASILSSSDGTSSKKGTTWGPPVEDKRCKGKTKATADPVCTDTDTADCDDTTTVFSLVSETEGCELPGDGYTCYEGTRYVIIGTVDCKVEIITIVDYEGTMTTKVVCIADPDTENLSVTTADDCKDEYSQEEQEEQEE